MSDVDKIEQGNVRRMIELKLTKAALGWSLRGAIFELGFERGEKANNGEILKMGILGRHSTKFKTIKIQRETEKNKGQYTGHMRESSSIGCLGKDRDNEIQPLSCGKGHGVYANSNRIS